MNALEALLRQALAQGVDDAPLDALPYAAFLGLRLRVSAGEALLVMPFAESLIGSPGRLHGGTVGAMLEIAGALAVGVEQVRLERPMDAIAKPVNVTVDYLREGKMADSFASATVTRLGRRVANVRAEAWQEDRNRLIAVAHMNVMVASRP